MKHILFLFALYSLLAFSCNKEDRAEIDRNLILDYLETNNLQAEEDPSGLFYTIHSPGTNDHPSITSDVKIKYVGHFLNGIIFDQTPGVTTTTLALSNLIRGWQIGIPLLGRGGSQTLFVPSGLGYGPRGRGSVPPNAILIFEIDLLDFTN